MSRQSRGGALGALSAGLSSNPSVDDIMGENVGPANNLLKIETIKITPWRFANRPESELALDEVVEEIKAVGQKVPVLVRPTKSGRYELVYGRRRYEACKRLGITVLAVVMTMDDAEAYAAQYAENIKRRGLSTYAQACDFKRALDGKIYPNQSALAKALNCDRSTVSEYMTYFKLPTELADAIGDLSLVTLRTVKLIARNADNKALMATLIQRASEIADGKLTDRSIAKLIDDMAKGVGAAPIVATGSRGQLFSLSNSRISLSRYARSLASDEEITAALERFLLDREAKMLDGPTN